MYRPNTYFSIGALTLLLALLVTVHVGQGRTALLKKKAMGGEKVTLSSGSSPLLAAAVNVAVPFVSFSHEVTADAYTRLREDAQIAISLDYRVAFSLGGSFLGAGDRGRALLTPQFSDAAFVRSVALPTLAHAPELTARQIAAVGGESALQQTAAVVDSTNEKVGNDVSEILAIDAQAGSILLERAYSLFATGAQNAAVLLSGQFAQFDSFDSSSFQDNTNNNDSNFYYQPDFQPQNTLPTYQDSWTSQNDTNTSSLWGGYTPDKTPELPQVPTIETQNGSGASGWSDWQPNTVDPTSVENQNGGSGATDLTVPAGNTSGFTVAPEVVQGNNNSTDSGSWKLLQPSTWSVPFLNKNSSGSNVTDTSNDSGSTDGGSWWSGAQNTITNFFGGSGNSGDVTQPSTDQNSTSNNSFFGSYIGQVSNSVVNFFSAAPSFWSGGTSGQTDSGQPDSNVSQFAQGSPVTKVTFDGEVTVGPESGFINAGFTKGAQCTEGYDKNEFSCGDSTSLKSFSVISGYSTFDSYLSKIRLAARTQSNEQQYLYIEKNGKGTWYLLPEGDTTSAFIHCGPISEALAGNPTRVVHIHTHPGRAGESVPPSLADAIASSMMKGMFGSNKVTFMVIDPAGNNWTYDTSADFNQKFKNAYFCGNNDADVVASFRNEIVDAAGYEQNLTLQGGTGLTPGQLSDIIEKFRGLGFIVNR